LNVGGWLPLLSKRSKRSNHQKRDFIFSDSNYFIMKKLFQTDMFYKTRSMCLSFILLFIANEVVSQQASTVLPNNASYSNKSAPQGALRYQRGFYLVTPAEMNRSGFTTGMAINSIGFTIGKAQNDTTKGKFRVLLQNTADMVTRSDTAWNSFSTTTNTYSASSLVPGNYEWQVKANCNPSAAYTAPVFFKNDELAGCNNPYNLNTVAVANTSATLTWEAATSAVFTQYRVEYTAIDMINWVSAVRTDTFYNATGLTPGKTYQWRVRTLCTADSSDVHYATFETSTAAGCNTVSGLTAVITQDSVVALSWTADTTASFYELQFKRTGTASWSNTTALTNAATLTLPAGTSYEWRVRINCGNNQKGLFSTATFITGGSTVCYPVSNTTTRQITGTSAMLSWVPVTGATGYTIRYRLKNTISWVNAIDSMTLTTDTIITIPDTTGAYDVAFNRGGTFTYNGGGVYVAWEYSRPSGTLSSPNLSLSTTLGSGVAGAAGQDSVSVLLSMVSRADTALTGLPATMGETRFRPETRFGSPGLKDSVAVLAVYALGKTAPAFQSTSSVTALITNKSTTNKYYDVVLTVKEQLTGAIRDTITQNVMVTGTDTLLVTFNGWAPVLLETDSIIVSIATQPGENVINNNRKAYLQNVNASLLSYDDGTGLVAEAGFGTGAGLLLNKHQLNGCGKVIAAKIYLTESAAGKPVRAVTRNAAGAIVATSAVFTASAADVNKYHSFYFTNPAAFSNEVFYIGLAQEASTTAYYPVGAQWEDAITRDSTYFRSNLDGSNLVDVKEQGRLMMIAEIAPSGAVPVIKGNLVLCTGVSNTLTAGSEERQFANSVINTSSQYGTDGFSANQALGVPNVFPAYGLNPNAWMSSNPDSISPVTGRIEFLEVGFSSPSEINFVDIYETFGPGAVDSIFLKDVSGVYHYVTSPAAAPAPLAARKNRIAFTMTTYQVNAVKIVLNSQAVTGFNAIDAIAIGKEINPAFSSYLWSPGGATSQTLVVSTPGVYKLTVTNASGCTGADSVTITSANTSIPIITPSGATAICAGDSVTLTSGFAHNNLWSTGDTTASIIVTQAGSYTVAYNDGSACAVLTSLPVIVSVNSLPVVTISGSAGICPDSFTTLHAGAGYTSYLWSTGQTTESIQVNTAGTFTVTVINNNGCAGSAAVSTFLTVPPVPAITGVLYFCPGATTTLDAGAGFASYHWSTNDSTRTINVAAAGTYTVTVTNISGCSGSDSKTVLAAPAPTPVISGTLSFCGGSFTTLDAGPGYSRYAWSNGEQTRSILVATADSFSVTVTNQYGCIGTAGVRTDQSGAMPLRPGTITGPETMRCDTAGIVYSIAPVANTSHYAWTVPPGATIVAGGGTNSITVDFSTSFKGGDIVVAASNACGQSPSIIPRLLTIKTLPQAPGAISGQSTAVCGPVSKTYSVTAVALATGYTWIAPTGASITSGQGSNTVTILFASTFNSGNVCVMAMNTCGTSAVSCLAVSGTPVAPAAISGPGTVCLRQSGLAYTATAVAGATSYAWTVPLGATISNGQGTNAITVKWGNNNGAVTVKAIAPCGTSAAQSLSVVTTTCFGPGEANTPDLSIKTTRPVPEIISSYGGTAIGGNLLLEYTAGEAIVKGEIKDQLYYTQGFHQPEIKAGKKDSLSVRITDMLQVSIFPNPVTRLLKVQLESSEIRNLSMMLHDNNGKRLLQKRISTGNLIQEIDMTVFIAGSYYLSFQDEQGKIIKSVKIIKVN
jgi:PKD-like domain/Fibronectin type III domain/Secretion system C-terminal sorting domain